MNYSKYNIIECQFHGNDNLSDVWSRKITSFIIMVMWGNKKSLQKSVPIDFPSQNCEYQIYGVALFVHVP